MWELELEAAFCMMVGNMVSLELCGLRSTYLQGMTVVQNWLFLQEV